MCVLLLLNIIFCSFSFVFIKKGTLLSDVHFIIVTFAMQYFNIISFQPLSILHA